MCRFLHIYTYVGQNKLEQMWIPVKQEKGGRAGWRRWVEWKRRFPPWNLDRRALH